MFGSSAERNGVERPARIDSGGTPPLRSLCTRKEALLPALGTKAAEPGTENFGQAFQRVGCTPRVLPSGAADVVLSRKAVFMRCCLIPKELSARS